MARVKLVVSRIKKLNSYKNNEIEMKGCNLQFIAGYKYILMKTNVAQMMENVSI